MKINNLPISLFFLTSTAFLNAQSISGIVSKDDKSQLKDIKVSITNKSDNYTVNADKMGYYNINNIKTGNYYLKIFSNKSLLYSEPIDIVHEKTIKNVMLNGHSYHIAEIVVEKNNKVIERKLDKIIFNVNESMYSNGFDAVEVLSKVPMVQVSEQGINILNRGKLLLLINNKRTYIEGTDLINYLKTIPSNSISKIEVITNPSSNFDAEGSVGVINIITKKDLSNLFSIGYSSSYTKRKGEGFLNGLNLSYNKNSLQITSRLNYTDQRRINTSYSLIQKNGKRFNESDIEQNNQNSGLSFYTGMNYAISKKLEVGLDFDLRDITVENNSTNLFYNSGNNQSTIDNKKKAFNTTINLYGTYKLDSLGKKVEISATSFFNNNDILQSSNSDLVNNNNEFNYRILSPQIDFTLPLKNKIELLTGAKATFVKNEQNYFFNQSYRNTNFEESIYAMYFSASGKLSEKITLKAGLRYENYQNEFFNVITQNTNKTNKNSFFPSIFADYDLGKNSRISFSYSRRVNRPNFRYLDPFRVYYSDNYYQTGNPNLQSFFTNSLELNYSLKNLNILLFRTENRNMFSNITKLDGDNQVDYFENFFNLTTTGINIRYSFNKIKNLESSIMTNISYSKVNILNDAFVPRNGVIFYYYIDNNYYLNKSKTVFLNLSYLHSLPTNSINSYLGNVANLAGGVKILLLQKQMQFNLTFSDLFRQQRDKGMYYYNGYDNTINNYTDNRYLTVGFSYKIGKAKTKPSKNTTYERNRTE
ncbi:TonB-dependent receptor domain-containing protein [Chryseobacterium viscerum]|uniref:TonB-dependent receptor domain-containing protein n=1 Tax=Chryseobacterium viscerum TaxID=1037377 RepID=UPI00222273C9|nr:TonB-dependent receptor [Chryseobacterium viscerum]MCW1962545.1 TonB-dependent receptor [Chryseobacterium viscerum]